MVFWSRLGTVRRLSTFCPARGPKRDAVLLNAGAALLVAGCARHYTMTLNSGSQLTTLGKPRLQNGVYVFKDAKGQPGAIPAGRVREVAPANMSSPRINSGFSAAPSK